MPLIFERSVVLFVSLAILLAFSGLGNSADSRDPETWYLYVVNGLGGNTDLLVHCKSREDDLGPHVLAPGTQFTWNFKASVVGKTLFWCFLNNGQSKVSFDVFWVEKDHQWLHDHCYPQDCFWIAKDDGIYLKNTRTNIDDLVHKWGEGR